MRFTYQQFVMLALLCVVMFVPLKASANSGTVTANLFVPGELNTQLPGVTAYLTNGNNPLGIGGYEAIAPTTPMKNNAKLTIDEQGRKFVVIDVLNPVFTLQQIENGKNVNIIDIVKDKQVYTANKNSIEGRITQLTVELLDDSGTYTFTNCIEYPTLLGVYWQVPLTLTVDLSSVSMEPSETTTTLQDGTTVKTSMSANNRQVITMTTPGKSVSETTISATQPATAKIHLSAADAMHNVHLQMPALHVRAGEKSPIIIFNALGEHNSLQVAVPVTENASTIVVRAQQANGQTTLLAPTYEDGYIVFSVEKNTLYQLVNEPKAFTDVRRDIWYYEPVQYMASREWLKGSANTFKPNDALTRGMFVTVLHRMMNEPQTVATHRFTDVLQQRSYTNAVAWAHANGYVKGLNDTTFGVQQFITREQFAVILWRYVGSPQVEGELSFTDAHKVGAASKTAFVWAVKHGILSGREDGTLNPKGNATRAQAAKMLMNFVENVQSK